jgi:hypothetical protein
VTRTPRTPRTPLAAAVLAALTLVLPALAAPAARAQDDGGDRPRRRFTFGPNVGFFLPSSGKARDAFGNTWTNVGFGAGAVQSASRSGRLSFDLSFINNNRGGGRRAFLVPVGVSYRQAFTATEDEDGEPIPNAITPYYGVSAGLYLASLDSDKYDVDTSLSAGGGGSVLVGVAFQRRAFLEARYHLVSRIAGFDLSGLNLGAGFRF